MTVSLFCRGRVLALFVLLLCCIPAAGVFAEDLSGEFWSELEPFARNDGEEYPLPKEEAVRRVLEEARFVFSGMIYGFRFFYTPSDAARGVSEIFELEPLAMIPWGDPRLSVMSTRVEGKRLFVRTAYRLQDFQELWQQGWRSNTLPRSGGEGSASLFDGHGGKVDALRKAIKESIRNHLRQVVFNKPKEVRGEVVLTGVPRLVIRSGQYSAKVDVKLRVEELVPYSVF